MKSQLQARPQSKNINKSIRPSTRYINPQLAQECFKKAKEEQQKQAFGRAIQQYLKALMYDPKYFQAYCNMGTCYRSQGKYLQSRSMYLKSIAIKEDDAISHYNLANVLRIIGNYEDSIKHYEFVISLQEKGNNNLGSLYLNSLVNIGICHKIIGQTDRAIDYYEKARKIDPKDQSIIYNQAMTYMASLQAMDADIYHQVSKEKASKAQNLFKMLSKNNPSHEMTTIKLYRISSILDKSNENLNLIVKKLKEMLSNIKTTLHDDINDLLGFVLKLLKQYQMSATHYQSMKNIKQSTSRKQVQANIYDTASGFVNNKVFQQEDVIKLIQEGQITQAQAYIAKLEDNNIFKHVLAIAIELHLYQQEQSDHLIKANNIFQKHLFPNKTEIPFDQLSIESHKIIGKLYANQRKYKQSIKHFEYISSQLKSNAQKSKIHSSLGNDYEALGDKQKALQQYQLALSQQPQNYQLVYNVGCCLHQIGNQQESNKYFQKFLALIEKDNQVYLPTKNLYIADCLVTMASSAINTPQQYKLYEKAWKAIKQVQATSQQSEVEFEQQKLTNYYLRWADLLQEKIYVSQDKKSQQFIQTKETLLQVYMNLLESPSCPDRDAILNNCAILYYQQKLYVNALANLNQVVFQTATSLNSLALIYLHLGEHIMATKSIYQASQKDPEDAVISFNKEVIQWIYGISHEGRLYNLIDNSQDSLIVARWHYGLLLIDALSRKLKDQDKQDHQAPQIIKQLIHNKHIIEQNLSDNDKIKFKFINSLLTLKNNTSNLISEQILKQCLTESKQIELDTKNLVSQLSKENDLNESMIGLLLNIFIFTNRDKWLSIKVVLESLYKGRRQIISIPMDRRVTILEESITKQYNYSTVNDIISNFCSWQCELQDKIITIIHIVQKIYYRLNFRYLLDAQYHIPRHNFTNECSMTLNRLTSLVYGAFKIKSTTPIVSATIAYMKNDIVRRMKNDFEIHMRSQSFVSVTLGQRLTFVTLHANFQSKEECIKFIKQIQKESNEKKEVQNLKSCDQVILIISSILKISCVWTPRNALATTVYTLLKSPLQTHLQSVLQIQQNLNFIKEAEGNAWELLEKVQAFN